MIIRRGGVTDIVWAPTQYLISNHHNSGMLHVKKFKVALSQLRVLASHKPIWASVDQGGGFRYSPP